MSRVKIIGIYSVTSPTNKIYIGQSWDIKGRWLDYRGKHCKGQKKLFASIQKHGYDNHKFKILHELPIDISQNKFDEYEQLRNISI